MASVLTSDAEILQMLAALNQNSGDNIELKDQIRLYKGRNNDVNIYLPLHSCNTTHTTGLKMRFTGFITASLADLWETKGEKPAGLVKFPFRHIKIKKDDRVCLYEPSSV